MNRGTLPIVSRLRSLQAVSRFVPGGGRVLAEAYDPAPLAQLLRAANETMLGRSLTFESDSGAALTLDVSGRRILRLTAAVGVEGADACLGVEVLEDEHKDDLIKLFQAVAQPGHTLVVTSGPIGRGGEQVSVGLPVALLADLLLVDLNESPAPLVEQPVAIERQADAAPVPAEPALAPAPTVGLSATGSLGDFAAAFGPELIAWLVVGGEDDGRSNGPEEMVTHLQGFLDDEREAVDAQLDRICATPGDPVCLMLGASLVDAHSILCARLRGSFFLGVVEGEGTGAVLKAWRMVLA